MIRQSSSAEKTRNEDWPTMSERSESNGDEGTRTPDLLIANQPLSQLSYIPGSKYSIAIRQVSPRDFKYILC